MADFSVDQKKLPGVKEVCRDFAVLEDHCLAHNLQEQEIESHLASNVHKSRLVQQDLQVAKKLQAEEDQRAKAQSKRQYRDIERQDNEIAQEIQEELVRQAERQRQQEEKDAAIARKLQEKEMKEERRRQKQMEANVEEEYYEDQGAARGPIDFDKTSRHDSGSDRSELGRYDKPYSPGILCGDRSPDYTTSETKRSRYPTQDPVTPHSRSRYPEHQQEGVHGRHADPYPEHLLPPRGKHGSRYPEYHMTETGRTRGQRGEEAERVVRRKERPARLPPPPQSLIEQDKARDRERDRDGERLHERDKTRRRDGEKGRRHEQERARYLGLERDMRRDHRTDGERGPRRDQERGRDRERSRERELSGDRWHERERQKERERQQARSRERVPEEVVVEAPPDHGRDRPIEEKKEDDNDAGERKRGARGQWRRLLSGSGEVFEEEEREEEGRGMVPLQLGEGAHSHSPRETGRVLHRGGGTIMAGSEFGLSEATQGLTQLDLREQEFHDMEVARKLQEEEIKASKLDQRAAQMAQDEEIARLLMEQEKKEYKKNKDKEKDREREKEKERERMAMDRMAMERRRQEAEHRPNSEEVVRPRTREEHEYQRQKNHNKPARPPQPRTHDYQNVNPTAGYRYSDNPFSPRAPSRPEAAYKGAYYRQ